MGRTIDRELMDCRARNRCILELAVKRIMHKLYLGVFHWATGPN